MNNITIQKEDVNSHFQGHWEDVFSHYSEIKSSAGLHHKIVCPFHSDSDPSLSFRSDTGLWKCFGCGASGDAFTFYGLLKGLTDFKEILQGITSDFNIPVSGSGYRSTKPVGKSSNKTKSKIVAVYDYGKFQSVRKEPGPNGKRKTFLQRRPDGNGGFIYNMEGVQRILYREAEVHQAELVLIPEGEQKVDNLRKLGFTATTNIGGAGKWIDDYNDSVAGKDVVLLPDADDPGRRHVEKVARSIHGVARSVKVLELPGLKEKQDVSDWIEAGGTKEELEKLISECPEWEPAKASDRKGLDSCVVDFKDLLQMDIPKRVKLFDWLPEGGIVMVYGGRGIGKTFFSLSLAGSLASGSPFLKWGVPTKMVGALIIDGEMALNDLRSRLTDLLIKQPEKPLKIISSEVAFARTERDINLVDDEQRKDLLTVLDADKEIRLVVIDNISCLFSGIRESSKDDWEQVTPWLLAMRRRGVAVLLVHHAGKGGDQRGTSGREDLLDTVIRLERVHGRPNDGARFIVRFTKSRGTYGDTIEPFEAALDLNSRELWTWKKLEESNYERMLALAAEGISSVTDMAEELNITKGMVSRLKKKGIDQGDLIQSKEIKLAGLP